MSLRFYQDVAHIKPPKITDVDDDFTDLLDSGLLSDVTVRYGDRTRKLHKAILCGRSKWFEKALTGNFQEAKTSEVVLDEHNFEALDWMFKWIYTRTLDRAHFEYDGNVFVSCVELFKLADFFMLEGLRKVCLNILDAHLRIKAREVQLRYCKRGGSSDPSFLDIKTVQPLSEGIYLAYESGLEELQRLCVFFAGATMWWILSDAYFKDVLDLVPKFAVDVLNDLDRRAHILPDSSVFDLERVKVGMPRGEFFWKLKRLYPNPVCAFCLTEPLKRKSGFWALVNYDGLNKTEGMCDKCDRKPRLPKGRRWFKLESLW